MSEAENQTPPAIRTPGPDPVPKPPAAGAISARGAYRNALEAAGDDDPDAIIPEAVAEVVDLKFRATGRNPNRPPGAI
jgi:hypothetical protein